MSFWVTYPDKTETPPALTLLINPNTFTNNNTKKINSHFSRGGWVIEEWGDMPDNLDISGVIGGYYIIDPSKGISGLNRYDRTKSASFQNIYALILIYRNNGAIFERTVKPPKSTKRELIQNVKTTTTKSSITRGVEAVNNRISKIGSVFMLFDNTVYEGAFDEFSLEEKGDKPFNLTYKFKFTVKNRYVLDYRSSNTYTQDSSETSDLNINNSGLSSQNIEKALNISTKASAAELVNITTNPFSKDLDEDTTLADLPKAMASKSIEFMQQNNHTTADADKLAYENIYKQFLNSNSYQQELTNKNDLINYNREVIDRTESNPVESSDLANSYGDIMASSFKKYKKSILDFIEGN